MLRALILTVFALITGLPNSAFADDACVCPDRVEQPREPLALVFWGRVDRVVTPAEAKNTRYHRGPHIRVTALHYLRDNRSLPTSRIRVDMIEPCPIVAKPGDLVYVRGYGFSNAQAYLSNPCLGTQRLGSPPPRTIVEKIPAPLTQHALHDTANAAFERVAKKCNKRNVNGYQVVSIGLNPGDVPTIAAPEGMSQVATEEDCAAKHLLKEAVGWVVDAPVNVTGSIVFGAKPVGASNVFECDAYHPCPSQFREVLVDLLDVQRSLPRGKQQSIAEHMIFVDPRAVIDATRVMCPGAGLDSARAFADEHKLVGGDEFEKSLRDVLIDCAIARGETEWLAKQLSEVQVQVMEAVAKWRLSAGDKRPLSVGAAHDLALPQAVTHADIISIDGWAHHPELLEAFALQAVREAKKSLNSRRLAALAFHKAALLEPDAATAKAYLALARAQVADDEIDKELEELRRNFDEASAERSRLIMKASVGTLETSDPEIDRADDAPVTVEEVVPASPQTDDGFSWLEILQYVIAIVGGLGIGAFLSRRK